MVKIVQVPGDGRVRDQGEGVCLPQLADVQRAEGIEHAWEPLSLPNQCHVGRHSGEPSGCQSLSRLSRRLPRDGEEERHAAAEAHHVRMTAHVLVV